MIILKRLINFSKSEYMNLSVCLVIRVLINFQFSGGRRVAILFRQNFFALRGGVA